ncbi:hypothetical protein A2U01_0057268, partial [Trifolium medium]|nr:hypothetical protein [Trifolium medium]
YIPVPDTYPVSILSFKWSTMLQYIAQRDDLAGHIAILCRNRVSIIPFPWPPQFELPSSLPPPVPPPHVFPLPGINYSSAASIPLNHSALFPISP